MTESTTSAWSWLRMLVAALLLWGASGAALAGLNVTNVRVNGAATTTVAPGATMVVSVTVQTTTGSKWRATSFTTTPASDLSWCYFWPNTNGNNTFTFTFNVEAPVTAGTYSLHTRAYTGSGCTGTASAVRTLPGAINAVPVSAVHHVRIKHDGGALTCSPEPVTLQACADAACTTNYTGAVQVTLGSGVGTWSSNPVSFSGGSANITLSNPIAGTVNLSGTVNSPAATNSAAVCYNGSTANSCGLTFATGSCLLDAVERTRGPNTAIYTKRSSTPFELDLLALNGGAINTTSTAKIDAQLVTVDAAGNCSTNALSPWTSVTLAGAASQGRGTVTFAPTRAAKIAKVRLVSGSINGCSSDNFAIRPDSLTVTATTAGTFASAASATASPALKAGSATFALAASASPAAGYDGAPRILQSLVLPSGTKAGTVGGAFSADTSGSTYVARGAAFTYSEVGYFKFAQYGVFDDGFADIDEAKAPKDCFPDATGGAGPIVNPNVLDGSGMYGCYFGAAETQYLGRFTPDHFVLTDGSIVNRSANAACAASTFSYFGEELRPTFTLTARNLAGDTTENYVDDFARLTTATQLGVGAINDPAAGARTPFPVCGATPAHPCITPGAATISFVKGVAAGIEAPLTVFRRTAALSPFTDFKVGYAPIDSDDVRITEFDIDTVNVVASATDNHALAGATVLRHGRMNIDNAYGSELLNLTMKLSAQYWTGVGYATNTLDSCTVPAFAPFVTTPVTDYMGGINATNMPSTNQVPGGTLVNGVGQLVLKKPLTAPASKGGVTVRSALPYLPGSARATFGVYKSGPVIHVREIY